VAAKICAGSPCRAVRSRAAGDLLSFVRQGLSLGVDFGAHSVEALLSVAETLEGSIYEADSLVLRGSRLEFALLNPPLRVGAFGALRMHVEGVAIDPERVWIRRAGEAEWRCARAVSAEAPLELVPNERTLLAADLTGPVGPGRIPVRLELESLAIPPTVWMEIVESPRREGG
jgi:hypothetical protein